MSVELFISYIMIPMHNLFYRWRHFDQYQKSFAVWVLAERVFILPIMKWWFNRHLPNVLTLKHQCFVCVMWENCTLFGVKYFLFTCSLIYLLCYFSIYSTFLFIQMYFICHQIVDFCFITKNEFILKCKNFTSRPRSLPKPVCSCPTLCSFDAVIS